MLNPTDDAYNKKCEAKVYGPPSLNCKAHHNLAHNYTIKAGGYLLEQIGICSRKSGSKIVEAVVEPTKMQ